jgi:transposase
MSALETARAFCRRRAVELATSDLPIETVADVLGVKRSTISRWRREGLTAGTAGPKSLVGRPRKLTDSQLDELASLLSKGAIEHGWPNELWTTKRMAEMIRRHFHVPCHPSNAWRIVTKYLGWTAQRPIQQLRAADEDETERWLSEDFPRIVERAKRRGAHLAFLDESGFMLAPTIRRTYAPRGRPPVCKVADPHGKISVIGAMTISPSQRHFGLYFNLLENNANFRGDTIVPFLDQLRRHLRGPISIVWDAIPIHRAAPVRYFLRKHPTIVHELFPRYAPDLNPVDKIWFYVKFDRLPNLAPESLSILRGHILDELHRLQHRPGVLKSLLHMTRLSSAFSERRSATRESVRACQ